MAAQSEAASNAGRELVMTRVVDAPQELVFKAWTEPAHLIKWWGPKGFTNTFHQIDIRPGGVWKFTMHGPDGIDYPNQIVFEEVVHPERLVYSHGTGEEDDNRQFHVTMTLTKQGDKTHVQLYIVFATVEERDAAAGAGAIEGGNSTLDRLEAELAAMLAGASVESAE